MALVSVDHITMLLAHLVVVVMSQCGERLDGSSGRSGCGDDSSTIKCVVVGIV